MSNSKILIDFLDTEKETMRALVCAALFVLGCNNPSLKKEESFNPLNTPIEAPSATNVSMGGMSVNVPNPGVWKNEQVYIPNLGNVILHNMMNIDSSGKGYMVAWADYPIPQNIITKNYKEMLRGGRDGAVSNVGGTLIWDREIVKGNVPGREFSAIAYEQGMKFVFHEQMFLKNNRLFQFVSIRASNIQMNDEEFFSSITVQ